MYAVHTQKQYIECYNNMPKMLKPCSWDSLWIFGISNEPVIPNKLEANQEEPSIINAHPDGIQKHLNHIKVNVCFPSSLLVRFFHQGMHI